MQCESSSLCNSPNTCKMARAKVDDTLPEFLKVRSDFESARRAPGSTRPEQLARECEVLSTALLNNLYNSLSATDHARYQCT